MQRIKTLGLAIVAVLAVTAVASASASAEACTKKAGSKKYALCINGERIGSPTSQAGEIFKSHLKTATTAQFTGFGAIPFGGGTNPITCSNMVTRGEVRSGEGTAKVREAQRTFTKCEFSPGIAAKCGIKEPMISRFFNGTLQSSPASIKLVSEGSTFVEGQAFNRKECPGTLAGPWTISQNPDIGECTIAAVETEAIEHEVNCEAKNSFLWDEGARAELASQEIVELNGTHKGQKFSIIESS
jgi:hypothetical protein